MTTHQPLRAAADSGKTGQPDKRIPSAALVPLALETRAVLPTCEAAVHVNRAEQTLRLWACREDGPIKPIRIHGRLGWRVADLKQLLGIADQ